MGDPAPLSPMEELSKDPTLGSIISNNKGAKLYEALKAQLAAANHPTRRRLLEDVLANRRWFLEPIGKAPSLSTVNGIGTMLYGQSEKDPTDGTYVATLWFVFFFVPLVPIAQYLVRPEGGRRWTFFGKVPPSGTLKRWRQVVALGAAAAAVAIAFAVFEGRRNSTVHFVNGLGAAVKIHAGKDDFKVKANDRVKKRLAQGDYTIRVTSDEGRVLEEEKVKIPGGYDVVAYNVLGAAPLYHGPVTYYASGHEGKDKDKDEPIFDAGKRLVTEKDVDFIFTEPPQTISMSEHQTSTTRTRFDLAPGGWKVSVGYLISQGKMDEATRLVQALVEARPEDEQMLSLAGTLIGRTRGQEGLMAFGEKLAQEHSASLQAQRFYQTILLMNGKREEALKQYRARAEKNPTAESGYLAARLELPSAGVALYQSLAKKFPNDVNIWRGLSWDLLQTRRFAEASEAFAQLAKLPHPAVIDELEGRVQALIGGGHAAEAVKLAGDQANRDQATRMLYARVARLAGSHAPFPPDHFLEDKGPHRSWYEAWFGDFEALKAPAKKDDGQQAAYRVVAAARKSGAAALAELQKAEDEVFDHLERPLTLLLAAQAVRQGESDMAAGILDQATPPASPAERDAVLEGKDSPELADAPLESQAAVELARAWRLHGAEAKRLIDRARADDLLHGAVTLALAWK